MKTTREEYIWEGRTGKKSKGFSSAEFLSKIRSKAPANMAGASHVNPTNQKISSGTWKWSRHAIHYSFSSSLRCSIAAVRRWRKKGCSEAEIFSRTNYQPQMAKNVVTPLHRGTAQGDAGGTGYQNHLYPLNSKCRAMYLT